MNTTSRSKREVFLEAIEQKSPDIRRQFIADACGENGELQREIERLLQTHAQNSQFMQHPATEQLHLLLDVDSVASELAASQHPVCGTVIGRYQLLEEIGSGGMGSVFKARQLEPIERLVAIKIIKAGMDTREVVARFEAERQSLAMMNHPGIARVLDAGATEYGRPYFVMEPVDGCPITEFCDAHQLTIENRLRILMSVCEAVQHAHHRGIIHRDLKPSNILVESVDGKPVVRVIDFGIQKAIGIQTASASVNTSLGEILGTPVYMSPEQAGRGQQELDTRSDVYSLGVILYELLTGQTPFARAVAGKPSSDELRRMIREADAPLPSLCAGAVAKDAARGCRERSVPVGSLRSLLQGELDWISMKALEKIPERRYESPSALAADLQRFLSDDVVLAGPPSTRYRLYKSIRKHRWAVLLFLGVSVSLLLGTVISLHQARIARNAQRLANEYLEESVADQARYRKLAWESTIRQAYSASKEYRYCDAAALLNKLDVSDSDAKDRPEWQLLRQELGQSFQTLLMLEHPLHEVRWIRRSNRIAVVGEDGQIYVVNGDSRKLEKTIHTGFRALHALAISPDGNLVAVGGVTDAVTDLARVCVFDLTTEVQVAELAGQSTTIESLEFSTDGKSLACGARYEAVQLFDIASGKVVATLPAERRNRWLSASPDGRNLVAQETTRSIWLSDFQSPFEGQSLPVPLPLIQSMWEPESGRLVCFLKGSHEIYAFDPMTQTTLAEFKGTGDAGCLSFSPDNGILVAGLESGEVVSWEMPSLLTLTDVLPNDREAADAGTQGGAMSHPAIQPTGRWKISNAPLTSISISKNSIFAVSFNGELLELRLTGTAGAAPNGNTSATAVAWSSDGSTLIAGRADGSVCEAELETESHGIDSSKSSLSRHTNRLTAWKTLSTPQSGFVTAIAVSADQLSIASASHASDVILLQTKGRDDRKLSHGIGAEPDDETEVKALAFSSASNVLAWTGDRSLHWVNLSDSPDAMQTVLLPGLGRCLAWSPDNTALFVGGIFSGLVQVDPHSGAGRSLESTGTETTAMQISADGRRIFSGHSDGAVRIWNLVDNSMTALHIHQSAVSSICLSHDGRIGVSADSDSNLALWFMDSGELIGFPTDVVEPEIDGLKSTMQLAFAPSDRQLLAASISPAKSLVIRKWTLKMSGDQKK